MTRKHWADGLPDNCLTRVEALHANTVTAACAEFAEDWKVRLKPGFAGDVIVFDCALEAISIEGSDLKLIRIFLRVVDAGGLSVAQADLNLALSNIPAGSALWKNALG